MTYKKIELRKLQELAAVTEQQLDNILNYIESVDSLQQIPLLTEAMGYQEVIHAGAELLLLSTTALMQELAGIYQLGKDTNVPGIARQPFDPTGYVTHSLNLNELDADFEDESEQDDDDDDDGTPPAVA